MAIIDMVSWSPQGSGTIYAYKFPENNLSTMTQLVVNESQTALLFSKGQLMGKFGPGKHTLSTENLPVLRTLYGIPFGGKNPFMAEVWFVNMVQAFNIPWQSTNIPVHDVDYDSYLPLAAVGKYGLKVNEPEKFVIKVVGTRNVFTESDMTRQFQGEISSKTKSAIVRFMMQNNLGYKQISGFLDQLSEYLTAEMNKFWNELGLELTKFYVENIDIDTSTEEGRAVKQSLASQTSQRITGRTWQQEQMFNTANNALGQMGQMGSGFGGGSTGNLLGGLVALNMMNSMARGFGGGGGQGGGQGVGNQMMEANYNQPGFGAGANSRQQNIPQGADGRKHYCGNCSKPYPATSQFCPHCGHKYRPCPACGTDNDDTARRCVKCGTAMAGANGVQCPACGNKAPEGTAFCPQCGTSLKGGGLGSSIGVETCPRCGEKLSPGAKFCPRCGSKR